MFDALLHCSSPGFILHSPTASVRDAVRCEALDVRPLPEAVERVRLGPEHHHLAIDGSFVDGDHRGWVVAGAYVLLLPA
jgi:hypothetical protein